MEDRQNEESTSSGSQAAPSTSAGGSNAPMFYLLLALAVIGFVPTVILPDWRAYQALHLAAQMEQQQTELQRTQAAERQRVLEAVRTDPAVGTRLAQQELAYRLPGYQHVVVPGVPVVLCQPAVEPLKPAQPPGPIAQLIAYLPDLPYDQIYCREPTRTVLMLLSGALVLVAFALFGQPAHRPDE